MLNFADEGSRSYPQGVFAGGGGEITIATFDIFKNPREVGGDAIEIWLMGNQVRVFFRFFETHK